MHSPTMMMIFHSDGAEQKAPTVITTWIYFTPTIHPPQLWPGKVLFNFLEIDQQRRTRGFCLRRHN